MKTILCFVSFCTLSVSLIQAKASDTFIVKDGQPRAEIVIAEKPPRTTRLAAQELQLYIRKITGAKLSIVTQPGKDRPVKIYVGRSSHTDRLKVTTKGLKHGAYRIVSGDDWLVLIGDDTNFTPIEPWPRSNGDWVSGRVHREWHRVTKSTWGNPMSQLRKHYTGSASTFGKTNHKDVAEDGTFHVWGFDERGSFNAVGGFLRKLGVRWYLPGELGEVVPKQASISLPELDETVRPDFPVRAINVRFGVHGRETARWAMRLGIRNPYGLQTAHGLHTMTHNEDILKNHPKWFAMYGGKRHNQPGQRLNQLCYSNEELLQETVRYVRAQFDHYKFDVVSVMPPDGYTAMCQCELCQGKDTPQVGNRGALSDYVWSFVNRVAKEVRKTHPDKMISNCAYGTYTLPPRNIAKLEPNVQVIIVGGRRPTHEQPDEIRKLREAWRAKTDNPIMIFENYPFTDRGFYLPAFIPGVLGESINATKGMSQGEDIWLSVRQDFHKKDIGFNHFLVYFTARMYWGGKKQNVMAMFDEYCRLFYGPASKEMRTFFRYCEDNWRAMEKDKAKADRALELFAVAKAKAPKNSVYARRIALIDDYLNGLRNKREQLAQKRGPVPRLRLVSGSRGKVVIDGKLDDEPWKKCPVASTGRMRELQTGREPIYGTSFKTAWIGNNLYFAIRCEDHPGEKLNVATTKNGDQAIWYGDVVEILLATESHSYYQIAVNPAGALIDLDRGTDKGNWFRWSSQAEVATQVGDGHWTIEIRIPVIQDKNDPLHQVIGHKPTQSLPWHINVCRQRIRGKSSEHSAFAPTGKLSFHVPIKFAHFYAGRSHQFDADATVTDYLIAARKAEKLMQSRKYKDALEAYVTLAKGKGTTDFQKADALEQAARCARSLRDFAQVEKLANQIPLDAVAKTVQMENLLVQRKPELVINKFGREDFAKWPFWQIGAGAFARGRAYFLVNSGQHAEQDLHRALQYTSDKRARTSILVTMGINREKNLKDEKAALEAYRQNFENEARIGSADQFRSVQGAARILARQGKFDEALATLRRAKIESLKGNWRHSLSLTLGDTLAAAGRKGDALKVYREVLASKSLSGAHREAALKAVKELEKE